MKVLHVVGKDMKEIEPKGSVYEFIDGDVYVIDNQNDIYIWIGKDCSVDEKTVGAWVANKLDNEERGGEPRVYTIPQGSETEEFNKIISINVIDGDTPGFLKHAELDMVEYKLYRLFTKKETKDFDDVTIKEVPMKKSSLDSNDVFVLDGNENIFLWIGKNANREEKFEGQKLMQKIDAKRHYIPLQYTIYEGENSKSEKAFYDMIDIAAKSGPVLSVEDKREAKYRPEGEKQKSGGFFSKIKKLFGK